MSEGISPRDRYNFPIELQVQILPIEAEAWVHLRMGRYSLAESLYRKILQLLLQHQETQGRALHKGAPLHQLGLSLYFQGEYENSIKYFLLAYSEDALSAEHGQEDNIDRSPACKILRERFLIDLTFLRRIKKISAERKENLDSPRDPNEILREAIERASANEANLLGLCNVSKQELSRRPMHPVLAFWARKVFIGGAFTDLARLRDIQETVIRLDYEPVLTEEFGVPDELIHHHNLMLLHTCKYAIFEVSRPAGQLLEIERTRDYRIEPLLVYSSRGEKELPGHLSAMLRTAGFDIRGYRDTVELREIITQYLQRQ